MKKPILLSLLTALLCLPALAGTGDEDRMKEARDKEVRRANEAASYVAVDQRFEEKYAWAKQDFPDQYRKMIDKRREAERAWKEAAGRLSRAKDYPEIDAIKIPAHQAAAIAYLAELELKAAASEKRWLASAEKSGSETARKASRALIENQRLSLEATKEKYIQENQLRELAKQRNELERMLDEEYNKMRRQEEDKRRKPDDHHRPDNKPEPSKPEPPKIRIE